MPNIHYYRHTFSNYTVRLSTGQTTLVIIYFLFSKPAVASYFASCAFSTAVPSVLIILLNLTFGLLLTRLLQIPLKDHSVLCHVVNSTVHCQAAPPICMRPWELYKFVMAAQMGRPLYFAAVVSIFFFFFTRRVLETLCGAFERCSRVRL